MFDHTKYQPFPAVKLQNRTWPQNQITQAPLWCAVDLRDGNQALVEPMSVSEKQKIWGLLIDMGFKHIEVGFPSASQTDFDFVRWLIDEDQIPSDVTIQALVQARDALIERTYEALKGAKKAIVHVYNSTSPTQRNKVFNQDKQGIIDIAIKGAQKVQQESKKYPETQWTFQYSPESFSSTEVEFAVEVSNAVMQVWQPTIKNKAIINLPATVECAGPNIFADQVEYFCQHINHREHITISIHTHNDRGCAVAAAEMAILAGADRIEGTLMGNGERTGNMDIVTMAMNLYSQGIDPKLDLSDASRITSTVEECTKIATHPRHPWMGELVYTAFSGSHQDAIKKCLAVQEENTTWDVAYLPIDPKDIGRDYQSVIRINSQSGKGGVAYILESEFGITMPRWMQIEVSIAVQKHSEKMEGEVNAQDIHNIFQNHFITPVFSSTGSTYKLGDYNIQRHQDSAQNEKEHIQVNLNTGQQNVEIHGQGDGALQAFCNALSAHFHVNIDITQFGQVSQGSHSDAQAMSFVQLKINGEKHTCAAQQQDSLSASLMAILQATNKYLSELKQAA
jgi:2-isopropylmalate synthase